MRDSFFHLTLVFFCFLATCSVLAGGQIVGNGGDLVQCEKSNENDFDGLYSLDYIVASPAQKKDFASVKSVEESLERIEKLLSQKIPSLHPSFVAFRARLFQENWEHHLIWEPAPSQLIEVKDEDLGLSDRLPNNCRSNAKVNLVQAIIRWAPGFS